METDCVITRDMTIARTMELCPQAPEILRKHGMACSICLIASSETIEEGAVTHGIDVNALLKELNECSCDEQDE